MAAKAREVEKAQKYQEYINDIIKNNPKLKLSSDDIKYLKSIYEYLGDEDAARAKFIGDSARIKNSGYLANVIRSGGSENDSKEIFARINNRTKGWKSEVWGQVGATYTKYAKDDNSLGDYSDTQKSGFIGYDKYIARGKLLGRLMLGAYSKVNGHDMSQGSRDEGKITNAGAGVYSSYEVGEWEVKAIISGSYDAYNSNKREVEILVSQVDSVNKKIVKAKDFDGYGIGCNMEGALKVKLSNKFNLKPYLGLDASVQYQGSMIELLQGQD